MMQIQPRETEVDKDTLPELQPIYNFMNIHSAKLYNEGYFLKLADLRPGQCAAPVAEAREIFRGKLLVLT